MWFSPNLGEMEWLTFPCPIRVPPGTGGGNKANLTSFKPGERRVGRQAGTPNRLPEFMQRLFGAAEKLGYMRWGTGGR